MNNRPVFKFDVVGFNAQMKKFQDTVIKFGDSMSAMKIRQLKRRGISFGEAPKSFHGTDI